MRHQYVIDPEIQAILPTLAPEELSNLKTLLVSDRHCDDLTVLRIESEGKNVLGDGHNRESICHAEGIPFDTRLVKVPDRQAALQWVIRNQLGRRNLTDERRSYYRGKDCLNSQSTHGGDRRSKVSSGQNVHLKTAAELAEEHGVSEKTIRRDAAFAQAVDALPPKEKEAVLNGQAEATKAEVIRKAKPPILCERCTRLGQETPSTGCTKCQAARAKAKHDAKKKRKKKKTQTRAVLKDRTGRELPDSCRDAFADTQLQELIATLEGIAGQFKPEPWVKKAGQLCDHFGFVLIEKFNDHLHESLSRLQLAIEALSAGIPYAVCPKCEGVDSKKDGKCCRTCRGFGHVPQHRFEELTRA